MNYNEIADALDREAVTAKAKIDAAEIFRKLSSIEGATKEAEAARAKAEQARDEAIAELERVKAEAEAATNSAKEKIGAVYAEAKKVRDDADDAAAAAVNSAEEKAKKILADAQADAKAKQALANAELSKTRDALAELTANRYALLTELDEIKAKADAEESRLADIRATIAKFSSV